MIVFRIQLICGEFGDQNEFTAMNLFLKAEALNVYVMDISQDLFSPQYQCYEKDKTFAKSQSPAEILRCWLNSVHRVAKKGNLEPNIYTCSHTH